MMEISVLVVQPFEFDDSGKHNAHAASPVDQSACSARSTVAKRTIASAARRSADWNVGRVPSAVHIFTVAKRFPNRSDCSFQDSFTRR